jgi:hypothetical protein
MCVAYGGEERRGEVGKPEGKSHLANLDIVDGKIILK